MIPEDYKVTVRIPKSVVYVIDAISKKGLMMVKENHPVIEQQLH